MQRVKTFHWIWLESVIAMRVCVQCALISFDLIYLDGFFVGAFGMLCETFNWMPTSKSSSQFRLYSKLKLSVHTSYRSLLRWMSSCNLNLVEIRVCKSVWASVAFSVKICWNSWWLMHIHFAYACFTEIGMQSIEHIPWNAKCWLISLSGYDNKCH